MEQTTTDKGLRRAVIVVALANLAYFGIEFGVARHIGSVALLADSIDFLEDASVNGLIAVALGWSLKQRARIGMLLAGILLLPALFLLWTAWQKSYEGRIGLRKDPGVQFIVIVRSGGPVRWLPRYP